MEQSRRSLATVPVHRIATANLQKSRRRTIEVANITLSGEARIWYGQRHFTLHTYELDSKSGNLRRHLQVRIQQTLAASM